MLIALKPTRVVQAVAVLFKESNRTSMGRLRLLKLVYLADREAMRATGRPITGDAIFAMKHGTVPSVIFDCIKGIGTTASADWAAVFRNVGGADVEIIADPGTDDLSEFEVGVLRNVAKRYEHYTDGGLRELTHRLPEYTKNYVEGTSRQISAEDILEALGFGERKAEILAEAKAYSEFDRVLALAAGR